MATFFLQITSTIPLFQSKTINHSTSKFLAQPQFFVYTVTSADMHTLHPFNITALTSEGVIESQPGFSSQSYLSLVYDRKAFFHFGRNRNRPKHPLFISAETDTETEKNFFFRPKPIPKPKRVQLVKHSKK